MSQRSSEANVLALPERDAASVNAVPMSETAAVQEECSRKFIASLETVYALVRTEGVGAASVAANMRPVT